MQFLIPFDPLHVAVGITHFKLSTTFSKICFINCEQKMATCREIIHYFFVKFVSEIQNKYHILIQYN